MNQFCSQCGTRFPSDAKFCIQCGTELETDRQTKPATRFAEKMVLRRRTGGVFVWFLVLCEEPARSGKSGDQSAIEDESDRWGGEVKTGLSRRLTAARNFFPDRVK